MLDDSYVGELTACGCFIIKCSLSNTVNNLYLGIYISVLWFSSDVVVLAGIQNQAATCFVDIQMNLLSNLNHS